MRWIMCLAVMVACVVMSSLEAAVCRTVSVSSDGCCKTVTKTRQKVARCQCGCEKARCCCGKSSQTPTLAPEVKPAAVVPSTTRVRYRGPYVEVTEIDTGPNRS